MRRRALHAQENHMLCPRRKVSCLGSHWPRRSHRSPQRLLLRQSRKSQIAKAIGGSLEKIPTIEWRVIHDSAALQKATPTNPHSFIELRNHTLFEEMVSTFSAGLPSLIELAVLGSASGILNDCPPREGPSDAGHPPGENVGRVMDT